MVFRSSFVLTLPLFFISCVDSQSSPASSPANVPETGGTVAGTVVNSDLNQSATLPANQAATTLDGPAMAPKSLVISTPDEALQKRSSELFDSVSARLQNTQSRSQGALWSPTRITLDPDWQLTTIDKSWDKNKLRAVKGECSVSDAGCHPQFKRFLCSKDADCPDSNLKCLPLQATVFEVGKEPSQVCQFPSDHLIDALYSQITKARERLDITCLAAPDHLFHEALVNGLSIISQRAKNVQLRLLYAGYNEFEPNILKTPEAYFKILQNDVAARKGNMDSFRVNIGWFTNGISSWNHSKIIIADSKFGLEGGINWFDKYLGPSPMYDISMYFHGQAIKDTTAFIDELWKLVKNDKMHSFYGQGEHFPSFAQATSYETSGQAPALTLGRLGALGENPSDEGLKALIDGAKNEVLISQQDLFTPVLYKLPSVTGKTFVEDNIFAAILRGVSVAIIQSDKGTVSFDDAFQALRGGFGKYIKAQALKLPDPFPNADALFCKMVSYRPLRLSFDWSKWANDKEMGLHNKMVIVDKSAFYIGSHNLYPVNLAEFGLMVFDPVYTSDLIKNYWQPMYDSSASAAAPCGK